MPGWLGIGLVRVSHLVEHTPSYAVLPDVGLARHWPGKGITLEHTPNYAVVLGVGLARYWPGTGIT